MKGSGCKTLICFLDDEFNGSDIFALSNLNPEKIVFLFEKNHEWIKNFHELKEYIAEIRPYATVENKTVKDISYGSLREAILQYPKENTIVNLSGGDKLLSLLAMNICFQEGYRAIFADLFNEQIFNIEPGLVTGLELQYLEPTIKDFIGSTGGQIFSDETLLFEDATAKQAVEYLVQNYAVWKELKVLVRNSSIISYSKDDPLMVTIHTRMMRNNEQYRGFLNKALDLNLFSVQYRDSSKLIIRFSSPKYKTLVFKAGTWLEMMVYRAAKEMEGVDDVKGGVMFLWDRNNDRVRNEADVLAAANGKLIYVSCKDTGQYDEVALNEMDVYSEQIGGEDVKKILVVTEQSYKQIIPSRSKAMGIDIIVFDGDTDRLKSRLRGILLG